ncbi:DUF2956 domain-containing protein [Shewanella marina]|uniref:DUF2956 domain-containing protein n=1 Tax=Shewanella marina TaxID=487319 RepID=UPI000470EF75|nr:DUF2956 domain-containing protein [Shewanella marina]
MKKSISDATKEEALKVAKATQRPGQTKEQTKLIAAGIEKGISEYKKLQKAKARDRDKFKKQQLKQKTNATDDSDEDEFEIPQSSSKLAWILLVISWLGFIGYQLFVSYR